MRIFLTGATGVIGRRVLPLLVGLDHSVTAVAHRAQSRSEIELVGAVLVQVDLFARDAIQRAVAGHDAVINLATHLPAGLRMFLSGAWAENDRIRRIASANLVDAAIAGGVTRFIQESFAPAYPDRGDACIDERTPIAPVRYNRSVVDAERSEPWSLYSFQTGKCISPKAGDVNTPSEQFCSDRGDRKLDVHVAFDLAPSGLIDELLGRLGDDSVAVVVQPVDQRPDRRISHV